MLNKIHSHINNKITSIEAQIDRLDTLTGIEQVKCLNEVIEALKGVNEYIRGIR